MKTLVYHFAQEFTDTPGFRYKKLGEYSGEAFREDILKPLLQQYDYIDIDGSGIKTWFNPSFLSEAFGVLAQELGGKDVLLKRIRLFSPANPRLEEKFISYADLERR